MTLASGIELQYFDHDVRAQDDLFRHVNGKWLSSFELPEDQARYGAFNELRDASEINVRALIEDLVAAGGHEQGSSAQQIADLFASFMDEATIAAVGLAPLHALIQKITDAPDLTALTRVLGELQRHSVAAVFHTSVYQDMGDATRYIPYFSQGGLGLPDEAYYREATHAENLAKYEVAVAKLLEIAGAATADEAKAAAATIIAWEVKLASKHWTNVECRDAEKGFNPADFAHLRTLAASFDFDAWLEGFGCDADVFASICVSQPSFFEGLGEVWNAENLATIKSWLTFHVIQDLAPYLTNDLVEANFDFFGRTLTGTPVMRDRWKRGVALCEASAGDALGQLYVAKHFPESHKAKMDVLVANLIEAYRDSINHLEWMTDETRAKALEKLDKFTPYVGYPTQWRDYSKLVVDAEDLVGNVLRVGEDMTRRALDLLGKPIQKELWHMTPQTVNAYYSPLANSIVFPAAILQPPFFYADADDAVNYGGIGAVIGHEIGHGFDDQGSRFDGDGNLKDWWTASDREAFELRTKALIAQYDAYVPSELLDGATDGTDLPHVNGALTIGENIGDLGGLGIALKAYALSRAGETDEPPVLDGFTGMQRVFLGWAQAWRTKCRPAEAQRLLSIDPHSPAEFRCNGIVTNLNEFYEAFDVADKDELFKPAAERIAIW